MIVFGNNKQNCTLCKHYDFVTSTCPAFPDKIPIDLLVGIKFHEDVFPEQAGTDTFVPLSPDESEKKWKTAQTEARINVDKLLKIAEKIKSIGGPLPYPHMQCRICKYRTQTDNTCSAFPGGIPEKYLKGTERHLLPDPEQNGDFTFEYIGSHSYV